MSKNKGNKKSNPAAEQSAAGVGPAADAAAKAGAATAAQGFDGVQAGESLPPAASESAAQPGAGSDADPGDEAKSQDAPASEPAAEGDGGDVQFPVTLKVKNNTAMDLVFMRAKLRVPPDSEAEAAFATPELLQRFYKLLDSLAEMHKWGPDAVVVSRPE